MLRHVLVIKKKYLQFENIIFVRLKSNEIYFLFIKISLTYVLVALARVVLPFDTKFDKG